MKINHGGYRSYVQHNYWLIEAGPLCCFAITSFMTSIEHEVKAFAESHIQLIGNRIQMFLAVDRQVRTFGQILADQAADVLVAATQPRAVRITEVDRPPIFWVICARGAPSHALGRRPYSCASPAACGSAQR